MEADYFKFMGKLLKRGHAQLVEINLPPKDASCISTSSNIWYLPHVGMYHPRKLEKIV